ncbi:MAG: hypothetical protein HY698_16940 [Deltaproteobacteria bacterium]|nr:hypothetical protein [Deltaproteobacteria bacterium]
MESACRIFFVTLTCAAVLSAASACAGSSALEPSDPRPDAASHPNPDAGSHGKDADPCADCPAEPDSGVRPKGEELSAMATHFDGLGKPTGGCGVPEDLLGTPNFVALNVQNTPGDYSTSLPRPIPPASAAFIGEFDNGRNCGRWIRVTIGDYCTAINDGSPGKGFCHGGAADAWQSDEYNGATLDFLVADSCQDGNGWCRDDRYHLDLATSSLDRFQKAGVPVLGLRERWNNRKITWRFIEAPHEQGSIRIGFRNDAQKYWPAIVLSRLANGIHGVESLVDGTWRKATMVGDNGQVYALPASPPPYRIRVTDAEDKLVGGSTIFEFDFPPSCGERCTAPVTEVEVRARDP